MAALLIGFVIDPLLLAQPRPDLSNAVRAYVSVFAPVIALTHVRVIDGTGVFPWEDETVVIRDVSVGV